MNTPIAPVNTPRTLLEDPQFADRFPLLPARLGADQLFTPLQFVGEDLPHPAKAPTVGQHTEDVLRSVLGYDDNQLSTARNGGALEPTRRRARPGCRSTPAAGPGRWALPAGAGGGSLPGRLSDLDPAQRGLHAAEAAVVR